MTREQLDELRGLYGLWQEYHAEGGCPIEPPAEWAAFLRTIEPYPDYTSPFTLGPVPGTVKFQWCRLLMVMEPDGRKHAIG